MFSNQAAESAVFSVTEGKYEVNAFGRGRMIIVKGESLIIARYNGKLAVKTRNVKGFVCDSVLISGLTGNDAFSLKIIGDMPVKQNYTGDMRCYPDMDNLVLINICDIEKYISGVVQAEGGNGKHLEYFKTQAVIARTYMYKNLNKHINDRYNLCDNTHCQAYYGLSADTVIIRAVHETRGQVLIDKDTVLIISAFHSNCGGETSSAEDVWLTSQPYLKSVADPYCLFSRSSKWEKTISISSWLEYLRKSGYNELNTNQLSLRNVQNTRSDAYVTGSFKLPFNTIRNDLNLRSAFFSVIPDGDSIRLMGRGYGHGVGLCQEGAMNMASKGYSYRQIIDFYYFGVFIDDIKNVITFNANKN